MFKGEDRKEENVKEKMGNTTDQVDTEVKR
jgi:hypothetical protein